MEGERIDYRIGTYEQEMLGQGSRGRLWFWLKDRMIKNNDNFLHATDGQILKTLFGGKGMIANPELICYSDDGKFITDKLMDFLRLDERHFLNTLDEKIIEFMGGS